MFAHIDSAAVELSEGGGAIITRPYRSEEEAKSGFGNQHTQGINRSVALEWIRAELKRHESLWDIRVHFSTRRAPGKPTRDDPLAQLDGPTEPCLYMHFMRLVDGTRKYMFTFDGAAEELPTIEEVIERIKSLYARCLVEQRSEGS